MERSQEAERAMNERKDEVVVYQASYQVIMNYLNSQSVLV